VDGVRTRRCDCMEEVGWAIFDYDAGLMVEARWMLLKPFSFDKDSGVLEGRVK
jgi:hypothetical protein